MERLIYQLSSSPHPLLARLFGISSLLLKYDPLEQEAIIRQAEGQVYGTKGLARYEEQETSELKRLVRRSLAQFLCQRALRPTWWIRLLRQMCIGLALPFQLMWLLVLTLRDMQITSVAEKDSKVVVFLMWERLRSVAIAAFPEEDVFLYNVKLVHLGIKEVSFFLHVLLTCPKCILYPEFLSNILRWLSYYGYVVNHFHPHVVGNFFEGVVSSSLMTAYLHGWNIRHVNLMHGELFFSADGAFCEFDEFHVWGQHFNDICLQRRDIARQFVIDGSPDHRYLFYHVRPLFQPRPKRLLIMHNVQFVIGSPTHASLQRVLQALDSSWEVQVRPHPQNRQTWSGFVEALNTDPNLVKLGIQVKEETPEQISLEQALKTSRVVVGSASMALIEAWIAGCKVVYLGGTVVRSTLLDRFSGSRNVIYVDDVIESCDIKNFVDKPAVLNSLEDKYVEFVSHVSSTQ